MTEFIKECLKPILGSDISDDIVDYIATIRNLEDYEEFMGNIVDLNNPKHVRVYEALKEQQFGNDVCSLHSAYIVLVLVKPSKKPKNQKERKEVKLPIQALNNIEPAQSSRQSTGKGKKKYVDFYTHDHKVGLTKGRHPCNCEAKKHDLINNCLKCGRIVCEQEGSGPCFFCDNMVCTRYEMEVLNANTKDSDKLYNHLVDQKKSKEWKRAIETRNRLIQTDQMGDLVKNKVYDDQNDYFDLNSKWMSEDEKDNLRKKRGAIYSNLHRSRKDMKLALDFASRTVIFNDDHNKYKKDLMVGVNKLLDSTERRFPKNLFDGEKGELIANIVQLIEEQTINDLDENNRKIPKRDAIKNSEVGNIARIANSDFLESVDQGMCLSMHQPWASLLVAGIKVHEGRTWKTEHRGRLWIAAASLVPDNDDILECEEMHRQLYNDPTLQFPKKYPVGCLLGCVTIDDCLSQDDYRQKFPNGDSTSPYVFICSNPVILPVFYPMQGQHKIFTLPKELHRTAKTALLSSKWV